MQCFTQDQGEKEEGFKVQSSRADVTTINYVCCLFVLLFVIIVKILGLVRSKCCVFFVSA